MQERNVRDLAKLIDALLTHRVSEHGKGKGPGHGGDIPPFRRDGKRCRTCETMISTIRAMSRKPLTCSIRTTTGEAMSRSSTRS